jgi:signal peptidase I
MIPRIREGNLLLVQHASRHIRLGDVIIFKRAESLTAHRVVLIRKHGGKIIYQTKGDNARSFDVPVDQSSVLGRVVCVRNANGVQISLERPYVRLLNFALALSSYTAGILYEFAVPVLKHNVFDF